MNQRIVYELDREDLRSELQDLCTEIMERSILSRYEGRIVDFKTACQVLSVSSTTLHDYIKQKKIQPLPRSGKLIFFDLAYLLRFNIKGVKHKKYIQTSNS